MDYLPNFIGDLALIASMFRVVGSVLINRGNIFRSLSTIRTVFRMGRRSWEGVAGATLFVYPFFSDYFPTGAQYLAFPLFGIGTFLMTRVAAPPGTLFLGASREREILLMRVLRKAMEPIPIAHLLTSSYQGYDFEHARAGYRTSKREDWHNAVATISSIVPLIFIDGRDNTKAVHKEITHDLSPFFHPVGSRA